VARVLLHRYRLFRQGVRPPAADDLRPPPKTARAFRLYQDSLASSHARMRPMDLPLTVITSSATREALGRDDIGWGRWASQLELVPVDGDHLSLLLQPDVAETARRIQEVLATWA
jgi:thioesterase domain-containing protein